MPPAIVKEIDDVVRVRNSSSAVPSFSTTSSSSNKRPKLGDEHCYHTAAAAADADRTVLAACCQALLLEYHQDEDGSTNTLVAPVPVSLMLMSRSGDGTKTTTKNSSSNLDQLRALFDQHGLRTSILSSPRRALSVYKDSCVLVENSGTNKKNADSTVSISEGKEFLVILFGLHPQQTEMERFYADAGVKDLYCLRLFARRIRQACAAAGVEQSSKLSALLQETEQYVCETLVEAAAKNGTTITTKQKKLQQAAARCAGTVAQIRQLAVASDPQHGLRESQVDHEYHRILLHNSTLSNAYLSLLTERHGLIIKDVYLKRCPWQPQYERITIYLYDSEIDEFQPPRFTFLPCLRLALDQGPETVAQKMVGTFWDSLLRRGYFATAAMKAAIGPPLQRYLLSGLAQNPALPLPL